VSAPCPVLGFAVEAKLHLGFERAAADVLRAKLIKEVLEPRGLILTSFNGVTHWSLVVQSEAGQATDGDRKAVLAWAQRRTEIARVEVGQIVDWDSPR
jgi:uncharacterized protein YggL (DUF469 family)